MQYTQKLRVYLVSMKHPTVQQNLTFQTPLHDLLPHHQPLAAAAGSASGHAGTVQAGLQAASLTLLCSSCSHQPAVLRLRWRHQHVMRIRFACANQRQLLHGWSLDGLCLLMLAAAGLLVLALAVALLGDAAG